MLIEASSLETWNSNDNVQRLNQEKSPATAVVWLKKNAMGMQEQISAHLRTLPGITAVNYDHQRPTMMRINFDFNQIRYSEIVNNLAPLGFDAKVVGF